MTETTSVRSRHAFDVGRLHTYLHTYLDDYRGPLSARQFGFGQSNPTFLLYTPGRRYVLRKKPPGHSIPTAHAVEREFAVMEALGRAGRKAGASSGSELADGAGCGCGSRACDRRACACASTSGSSAGKAAGATAGARACDAGAGAARASLVPVPEVYLLCEDASIIGTPFYVMQYVAGRIFTDPLIPGVSVEHRRACYRDVVRVLAALHSTDIAGVGLQKFGRMGGYYKRQMRTLTKVHKLQTQHTAAIPDYDRMVAWLNRRMPRDSVSIVHGDFKVDNLVFHPTEPRVIAVLDWEMSTIGHPMADVANLCAAYHMPRGQEGGAIGQGLAGADLEAVGVPTEQELVAMYCKAVGRAWPDPDWPFYTAAFAFKTCVIIQGVAARAARGVASSAHAGVAEGLVPLVAAMALGRMEEADAAEAEAGARSRL